MTVTACNPMNLSYRFQLEGIAPECCREAADPSVVPYGNKLWLFASKSGGYWWTDDMRQWNFIESRVLPVEDYAPDARVIDGWLYCTASRNNTPSAIYRTKNPLEDQWELISEPFPYWDPNMFQDDDGRVYLYWGCSDKNPLYGVELNRQTMQPLGEPTELWGQNQDIYGWERKSENNEIADAPYIEGPWMTKHNGKYYLQYAAPGTEHNTYGDGVYIGTSPLGSFTYAANNPFSYKPGGFIKGAGHGSTFEDKFGNLWHISTMRISQKHAFERRIGIWPAGFSGDGELFCNCRFGDYPYKLPEGKWNDPWQDLATGWMLLSYNKQVQASSSETGYTPEMAVNEDVCNYWAADNCDKTPWFMVDLGTECTVNAIQINFAEHLCNQHGRAQKDMQHSYKVLGSLTARDAEDDGWQVIIDSTDNGLDSPHAYHQLADAADYRYIMLQVQGMPAGGRTAVSGLRIFGNADGQVPSIPEISKAIQQPNDPLTADVSWNPVAGADGYNIRWGYAPDSLYHDWQVFSQTEFSLPALNKNQETWVAVEAFNESGISALSQPHKISVPG